MLSVAVPKSAIKGLKRYWGDVPLDFFEKLIAALSRLGFAPVDWSGQNINFESALSEDVTILLMASNTVPDWGSTGGKFDFSILLCSKLLDGLSTSSDPWQHGPGAKIPPYLRGCVIFHMVSLSQLEWLRDPSNGVPTWATDSQGLERCIGCLEALFLSRLGRLDSAADVRAFILAAAERQYPAGMPKIRPGTRFSREFADRLQRFEDLPK